MNNDRTSCTVTMKVIIFVLFTSAAVLAGPVKPRTLPQPLPARAELFPQHPVFAGKEWRPKIVGGNEATPHSIPYQAGLYLDGSFCGGSLISESWVLTAAHCGELTNRPIVVLGAHRIQDAETSQVLLQGTSYVHELWDPDNLRNDIALIYLQQKAPINSDIQTVNLAPATSGDFAGVAAQASGWGLPYDGATSISPVLRYVVSVIITNEQCQEAFGSNIPVYGTVICLDGSQGKSTCSGDSGGPLVTNVGQVGLTSFGVSIGCEKGFPAAFTRISSYRSWIAQKTGI